MRCRCCDALLTDFEATRKRKVVDPETGEVTFQYFDECNHCFSYVINPEPIERDDLRVPDGIEYENGDQ